MRVGWLVVGWALGSAVRRLSQRTGVTDAEAFGTLSGDDVIPHPMAEWTRGATLHAAPERIWPWLVQMGLAGQGGTPPHGSTGSSSRHCSGSRVSPHRARTGYCRSSSRLWSATSHRRWAGVPVVLAGAGRAAAAGDRVPLDPPSMAAASVRPQRIRAPCSGWR